MIFWNVPSMFSIFQLFEAIRARSGQIGQHNWKPQRCPSFPIIWSGFKWFSDFPLRFPFFQLVGPIQARLGQIIGTHGNLPGFQVVQLFGQVYNYFQMLLRGFQLSNYLGQSMPIKSRSGQIGRTNGTTWNLEEQFENNWKSDQIIMIWKPGMFAIVSIIWPNLAGSGLDWPK